VFRQRTKDKDIEELNQTFNVRSIEYTVDLERYTAIPQSLIDIITFKVNTDKNDN
jgi:predicted alternative tryptophan synthase beta-subunit